MPGSPSSALQMTNRRGPSAAAAMAPTSPRAEPRATTAAQARGRDLGHDVGGRNGDCTAQARVTGDGDEERVAATRILLVTAAVARFVRRQVRRNRG